MFAMLLLTSALAGCTYSKPCHEASDFEPCPFRKVFVFENEQFSQVEKEREGFVRSEKVESLPSRGFEKTDLPEEQKNMTVIQTCYEDDKDVVDREDHFTQHLADLHVNTDAEITSLEVSENDELTAVQSDGTKLDGSESYIVFLTD